MAIRTNQVIGPITLPTTGVIEHDSEPDNQQGVDRLLQVARIMVLLISARPSETTGLNLHWPVSFRTHGNLPQEHSTLPYGNSDQLGAAERVLKVWSTVKIRETRVPQKAIVPVGRPSPYSIIILNMRFIPKASLRASSQITASSYILERHL